jgi:hypothetical protein
MGDKDSQEIVTLFLDEAQIRINQVDARQVLLTAEAHAAIDQNPLPVICWPETVKRSIHSDLAEAAEGQKDQFVLVGSH